MSPARTQRRARSALGRGVEIYRARGVRATWFSALGETGYRRLLLFERPLDPPIRGSAPRRSLRVERLHPSQVEEYRRLRPDSSAESVRGRLAAGESCMVGRLSGRLVAAGWVARGRASIAYLGGDVSLADDEAYLYDWFTQPHLRGLGIGTLRLAGELRQLQAGGIERALVCALPENPSAFGPLERMGFAPGGIVRSFRVGPRTWIRPRRGARRRTDRPPHMRPPGTAARALLAARSSAVWPSPPDVVPRGRWGAAGPREPYSWRLSTRTVVVHHTGLRPVPDGGPLSEAAFLRKLQRRHLSRGWIDLGYHFVIMPSGRTYAGRPSDAVGAHAIGHNDDSLGVALAGDFDVDRPSSAALKALSNLLTEVGPNGRSAACVVAHGDLSETRCPGRFLQPVLTSLASPRSAAPVTATRLGSSTAA